MALKEKEKEKLNSSKTENVVEEVTNKNEIDETEENIEVEANEIQEGTEIEHDVEEKAETEQKQEDAETEAEEKSENAEVEKNIEDDTKKKNKKNKANKNNEVKTQEKPKDEETQKETETEKEAKSELVQVDESINLGHQVLKLFQNLVFTFLAIIVLAFSIFTIANTDNSTISSGISILGIDVSKMDRNTATENISAFVQESLENDILLKHNEFEANIGPEQLETKVNVNSAIDAAFEVGTGNNIFSNSFKKLSLIIKPVNINPSVSINNEQLEKTLNDISTQLPDAVKQSNYYTEGNNLIVTSGKAGVVIDVPTMANVITEKINNLSYINNPIEVAIIAREPDSPNIEAIYNEVHKEAKDAYYDSTTHVVYPEENGLDFNISLDEAKNMLSTASEEYTIPLKVLKPNVTTNMIGMEAFPELLSSFSTRYAASNVGRTTNLRLAASKINGMVLLPGETFSYNSVVGERTIAAGYKEAAIYQDGQVVNGLGGGICQISTTLYNAALYANLQVLERRNHQFVPSYVGAGRDATVVYGSQDFKFKNTRKYAIKIMCSVEKGIATFNIYGNREENEYEVVITSGVTSRGANYLTSATYKTLKQNGQVVSSETISRDTYKTH